MIEPIMIKVTDKVPELVSGPDYVVCDNSDYTVAWQLDEEWAQFESRTMQVNYKDGTYERVLFTGNTCALPALPVPGPVHVGLFAGNIHTTRPARLLAVRSATTDSGEERDPMPNGYAQAIKALDGKLDKNQGAENAGKALVVGDDGGVVPGEAQGSSLPAISSDTAGKMLTNDGEKAEWGDVPKEVMVVHFTQGDDGNWSADKNWGDAAALIESGGLVFAFNNVKGTMCPCVYYKPLTDNTIGIIQFYTASASSNDVGSISFIWHSFGYIEYIEDGLDFSQLPFVRFDDSQSLTSSQQTKARENIGLTPVAKTDAMTQSVGLDAETGELYTAPAAGDNTLGITGARVGQIAKITAVDTNGKPTAWEAVDMAGGDKWEKLINTSLAESVESVTYTFDNCKRIKALIAPVIASDEPVFGWKRFTINNVSYPSLNNTMRSYEGICLRIDSEYPPYVQANANTNTKLSVNGLVGGAYTAALENIAPNGITEFGCQTAEILKAGTKIEIWGVKS